jgi:outer membrane lipoprotein carrier protein
VLLALGLLGNGATAEIPAALDAIQARYDGITDLSAGFVQTSYTAALGGESVSAGRLTMKRPGLIRWEYSPPNRRVIVLNADTLRIYNPLDEQLQIAGLAKGTVSPTALSFLLGEGVLRELFTAVAIDADDRAELGLRLDPRQESGFEFIELWVDRETYQLRESVLVDLFKNRTSVRFDSIEENAGVDDSSFDIEVPEGTEVIDLR